MKILWFANTPCLASEKLNPNQVIGGWLYSLNEALAGKDDINLSVCFYTTTKHKPFTYRNTDFFPIYRDKESTTLNKIKNRLLIKPKDKKEIVKLLDIIRIVKPDIIHIHGTEENFGLIQDHITVPTVISLQGVLSPISKKYFSGIPQNTIRRYDSFLNKLFLRSFNRKSLSFRYNAKREMQIFSMAKHIIGRTDWDRRVSRALAHNSKYYVVNEILRSEFYEVKWNKDSLNDILQLISITSDGLYKGFETIVKTATLLTEFSGIKFSWNVVGLNENSNVVQIVERWLKMDFEKVGIKFLGRKNASELANLLQNADIYCQVSHIENSPNSLAEAMLVGMPIVATNVGGTSTLLENKKEGILVQEGEPYEFAGAILEVLNDIEIAKKMAENARTKAMKTHNRDTIVEDLLSVYNSLIE